MEFGVGRDTLRRALMDAGHKPTGERVKYSTKTIHDVLSKRGGLEAAREAETWERHRQLKLENEKAEGTHWHKQECLDLFGLILQAVRSRITSLPTTQAANVNPTDPESGYNALQAWVDSVMPLLRSDIRALSEQQQTEKEAE